MATIPFNFSELLKDIPEGAWVAISEESQRVVAYSADFQTALDQAHRSGESDPLILRVPEQSSTLFL